MDERELEGRLAEIKKASEKLTSDLATLIKVSMDLISRVKVLEERCERYHSHNKD